MAATSPFSKMLDLAEKFVIQHQGRWNHENWEQIAEQVRSLGYPCDEDECKRNLGNILESCKYFYNCSAGGPCEPSAPARKKAPAKKKASS